MERPNFTNISNKLKEPPKVAQLNNHSSIINNQLKGEPNLKKYEKYERKCIANKDLRTPCRCDRSGWSAAEDYSSSIFMLRKRTS